MELEGRLLVSGNSVRGSAFVQEKPGELWQQCCCRITAPPDGWKCKLKYVGNWRANKIFGILTITTTSITP